MPSSVHSTMLAELQGSARVFPVFELVLGSTTYRYAPEPVASLSNGLYKPYVTAMDGFDRQANTTEFSLQIPSPSVTVFDAERELQKAIGGPQKAKVRNSVARCYLRTTASGVTDYQFFAGVVTDYKLQGDRSWSFTLAPNTEPLMGQPKIPFLTKVDFPDAPLSSLGQPLWIVYGKHASSGVTDAAGMVAALPAVVDASGDSIDWVLSYGQMTIDKIYRTISNELTEDTANWGFYTLERGTHRYQMARYTGGGTNPTPDDEVRVDCQGLFEDAPVSGTTAPFENPVACIRNFLGHFAYGDGDVREGRAWTDESTVPLATAILDLAEAYYSARGHVMAKVIRADEKVLDVFNDWCKNWNAAPFWTDAWELAAIPEDEADTDIYHDDRHIMQIERDALGDIQMDTSRSQPVSSIQVNYLLDEAAGSLTESRTVTDPSATNTVRETFDFEWGDKSLID